jgi:hypothetical protein
MKVRFSLRSLVKLVVGVSVILAIGVAIEQRRRNERAIADDLLSMGCDVDWESIGWRWLPQRYRYHVVRVSYGDWLLGPAERIDGEVATLSENVKRVTAEDYPFDQESPADARVGAERANELLARAIGQLPHLTRVEVSDLRLSVDVRKQLSRARIKQLSLSACPVSSGRLSLPETLQELRIDSDPHLVEHVEMDGLSRLTQLQVLELPYTSFSDRDLSHLTKMVSLKELNLSCTEVDGTAWDVLAPLPRLSKLDVSGDERHSLVALKGLMELEHLRILILRARLIDRDAAMSIRQQGRIASLNVSQCAFQPGAAEVLGGAASVQGLTFDKPRGSPAELIDSLAMPALEFLSIKGCRFSLKDLETLLVKEPSLARLYVTHIDGQATEIVSVLSRSSVEYVDVEERTYLTDQEIAILTGCRKPKIDVSLLAERTDDEEGG